MKQSAQTKAKAPPAEKPGEPQDGASQSGAKLAQWMNAVDAGNSPSEYRSPLEVLAERLERLNRTSVAVVRENAAGAAELSQALLERLRHAEERTASIFEALLRRNEETEARTAAVIEAIARSTRETEMKTASALTSVAQWIEAAERSPKIAVTEAMERRDAQIVATVAERLEQIEGKLPKLDDTVAQPIRSAIERLEGRLEGLASDSNALRELPAAFTKAAADLDTKLADVASRLDTVQKHQGPATDGLQADHVARIEEKLSGILDGLAARPAPAASEVVDGRLAEVVDQIAARQKELDNAFEKQAKLAGANNRASVLAEKLDDMESAHQAIAAEITQQLEKLQEQVSEPDPAIADLRRDIADIARAVAEASPVRAIESLERQVAALAQKLEASRERGVSAKALAPIETLIQDLAQKVLESRPLGLDEVQSELRVLSSRFDQLVARGTDNTDFGALVHKVGAIHDMIGDAVRPEILGDLAERIEALGARIDRLGGSDRDAPMLSRLAQDISDIRALIDKPGDSEGMARIEARLEALAGKMERFAAPTGGVDIDDLTRRIDLMHKAIQDRDAGATSADLDTVNAAVADIRDRIERVDQALDSPRAMPSSPTLEAMITRLAEKLDAVQQPDARESAFVALEQQVGRIAERLDANTGPAPDLSAVERQLAALFKELDQTRTAAIEAARRAAEEVVEKKVAAAHSDSALQRELADLRNSHDSADQRTRQALDAVHRTLEKVVERLSHLDNAADDAAIASSPPASAAAPSPSSSAPAPAPLSTAPAPEAPARVVETPFTVAPDPILEAAQAPRLPADVSPPTTIDAELLGVTAPAAPKQARQAILPDLPDDFPIEPGNPGVSARASETEATEAPLTPADSRSSFIAAARRAAQQAAAETAASTPTKTAAAKLAVKADKAAKPEVVVADGEKPAKAKAKLPMPALLSGGSSPLKALRTVYAKRRRAILIGLAAVVLALGSLQIARVVIPKLRQTSEILLPAPLPTLPKVTQPPQISLAPIAPPAQTQSATTSEPAAPAPQKQSAVTPDAMPTGSIPDPAKPAPVATPSVPRTVATIPVVPSLTNAMTATDPGLTTGSLPSGKVAAIPEALEIAVNKGVPRAMFDLATRLADARGADRNLDGAATLYRKAAEAGFAPAQYRLGSMYEKGLGVNRDARMAMEWYQRAADNGNVKAMHNMAVMFAEGATTGKPDYNQAVTWFQMAAERGLKDSQYNLAILSARGLGLEASLESAYRWFALAALQGDEDAARKRDDVARRLTSAALEKLKTDIHDFEPKTTPVLANEETLPVVQWEKAQSDGA